MTVMTSRAYALLSCTIFYEDDLQSMQVSSPVSFHCILLYACSGGGHSGLFLASIFEVSLSLHFQIPVRNFTADDS